MARRKIVFAGNCQADMLSQVYNRLIAPLMDDVAYYFDVQRPSNSGDFSRRVLAEADLVVEQRFDFPPKIETGDLKAGAERIFTPSVVLGFLWPYYGQAHVRNEVDSLFASGAFPAQMGDRFLNEMIKKRVPAQEALDRYLALDIVKKANVDRVYELYQERQRARDLATGYDFATLIEEHFRSESLVMTPDHPRLRIFNALAKQCYCALGCDERDVVAALSTLSLPPFPKEELPIHPAVSRHFGLSFADEATRYIHLEEGAFTFAEYVLRYMAYAHNVPLRQGKNGAYPPEEAARLLEDGLRESPRSFEGWLELARCRTRLRQFDLAKVAAAKAIGINPADPEGPATLADAHFWAHDLDAAEAAARQAVEVFPSEARARALLARILSARGRHDEAIDEQRRALALAPGEMDNRFILAALLRAAGRSAEAIEALRRATALRNPHPHQAVRLADEFSAAGCADEAVAYLRAWSTAEAPDGRVSARLAALLADRGELEEAERCASAALAEGAVEANDVLDRVLTASGRGSEVLGRARALADREPSCAHFLAVARIAQARGDTATAEEALKLGLARPDASREAREALAQLLEAQGRWPDAIAATREAVRADPANPHIVARLGRLLRQNGDIAGAETAFRSAIAIDGRFAGFHHELADVLAKSGRDAEALASSSRAVAIDPSDAHALVGLSNHLRRSGDFDGAETALRRACALQPSETSFAHALEQCLAERRAVNEEPSA